MTVKYDPIFIAIPEGKRTSESVCGRGVDSAAQPWTSHDERQKSFGHLEITLTPPSSCWHPRHRMFEEQNMENTGVDTDLEVSLRSRSKIYYKDKSTDEQLLCPCSKATGSLASMSLWVQSRTTVPVPVPPG